MPKKKSASPAAKRAGITVNASAEQLAKESSEPAPVTVGEVASQVQWALSGIFALHFMALIVALSSNWAPSFLQGELMNLLSPYLTTTHQAYGSSPLQLTHAEQVDFPLQIQWLQDGSDNWQIEDSLTRAGANWKNFSRVIKIIGVDLPESEVLSEVGLRLVQQIESRESVEVKAVRFVVSHVLSFDEDLAIATGREELLGDDREPTIIFDAVVIRKAGTPIGLIPQQDASRTSKAVSARALP